ncbi:MAG: hypothetical protein KGI71_04360 [Patescibacteria group bacterium]|nr:hypothetical protein [Patescibacteria group bacterium]
MILDAFLLFSGGGGGVGNGDGKTDSPTTGTQVSSNVIDLGVTSGIPSSANGGGARDIGTGDDPSLKLMVDVTTTFLGAVDLQIILQGAPDDGTGAPGSYTTMYSGPVVLEASLLAGIRLADIDIPRPVPGQALPRFLRLEYVTSSGTHSAGALEAGIVIDRNDQVVGDTGKISGYPAGINVAN